MRRVDVQAIESSREKLASYASISIAFEVKQVLDVAANGELVERHLERPYLKDYDAHDGGPARWTERFDLTNWGLFCAWLDGRSIGGAAVAFGSAAVTMLEQRSDLALLWDLRVSPEYRGQGVGSVLLSAAQDWALARGCRQLKVETQNINVPACRFYARHRFVLRTANRFSYPELPDEVQLLWYKDLGVSIRAFRDEDEAEVVGVWHRSGQATYAFLPTWKAFTLEQASQVFREELRPQCEIWVASRDESIVGFLAMRGSYIDRMYVDPSQWRQGVGTRLIDFAKSRSPAGLELYTHQENDAARRFYEKHGFRAVKFGVSPPPESAPDVEYHWRPA